MANSKDVQGHKDKYLETSRKILQQEMLMCNMKAFIFIKVDQHSVLNGLNHEDSAIHDSLTF